MRIPPVTVTQVEEEGRERWRLEHQLGLPEIPGAPADGPYDTRQEAEEARERLIEAWKVAVDYRDDD